MTSHRTKGTSPEVVTTSHVGPDGRAAVDDLNVLLGEDWTGRDLVVEIYPPRDGSDQPVIRTTPFGGRHDGRRIDLTPRDVHLTLDAAAVRHVEAQLHVRSGGHPRSGVRAAAEVVELTAAGRPAVKTVTDTVDVDGRVPFGAGPLRFGRDWAGIDLELALFPSRHPGRHVVRAVPTSGAVDGSTRRLPPRYRPTTAT